MKINGKEFSEETIALALEAYIKSHPEPKYQFQKADVAKACGGGIRVIVRTGCKLNSFDLDGDSQCLGQENFELNGYKKIGVLKDFIKE